MTDIYVEACAYKVSEGGWRDDRSNALRDTSRVVAGGGGVIMCRLERMSSFAVNELSSAKKRQNSTMRHFV